MRAPIVIGGSIALILATLTGVVIELDHLEQRWGVPLGCSLPIGIGIVVAVTVALMELST